MTATSLYPLFLECDGVSTDTRNITSNVLFFALKGDRFNGNAFAQEAIDAGARYAVIDEEAYAIPGKTFLCDDVLNMLQELATYHRKQLGTRLVALTGSNGKTTTKELMHAVLSQQYETVATQGNLNNHIGVPLTLLRLKNSTEIGVIEMGANHIGEIALLSKIAAPDFGYITNFGKAHIEGFGSLEGVVQGKTELYRFLKQHGKTVFVFKEDEKQCLHSEGIKRITFGPESADITIQKLDNTDNVSVTFRSIEINSQLTGDYHFGNIAAAIAVGAHFGVSAEAIKKAIATYVPQMNRSERREHNGHHIILDAYNANPTSMMAALEHFAKTSAAHKVVILGDMFELGAIAEEEHQAVTDYVGRHPFDAAYLVGSHFAATTSDEAHVHTFNSFEALAQFLDHHELPKSHILIKGSRGMALERSLPYL